MGGSVLRKAVKIAGSQTALAAMIGKTQGHISKWLERGYIPPDAVLAIERATGISRHELRPDLYPPEARGFAESGTEDISRRARDLPRRHWSLAEIEAMVEAGVLLEDDRFELIAGEIIPMPAKGNQHELLKGALTRFWAKRLREEYVFITETTFRLNADTFLEPDFVFYRTADGLVNLKPETVLLAVEIADSSLGYDLGRKALLYAKFAIRELWVIDAVKLETHILRRPGRDGYEDRTVVAPDRTLTPDFAPELAVRLAELQLV